MQPPLGIGETLASCGDNLSGRDRLRGLWNPREPHSGEQHREADRSARSLMSADSDSMGAAPRRALKDGLLASVSSVAHLAKIY